MTHSPHRSPSGKGAESGERKPETEETAKFKDLAKKLLRVPKEELRREMEKHKSKKP